MRYTPVSLDNKVGVLDVESYVPHETILDTSGAKVMLSKNFVVAMSIHATNQGIEFVSASGAMEVLMGVIRKKMESILSRGAPCEYRVSLLVTMADTTT